MEKEVSMKTIFRNGALALAVIAGSALVAAPAMAKHHNHHHGYHHHGKKSWKRGYYGYRDWDDGYRHHHRHHRRYYGYGWGWPGYYYRPGFSIYIR